MEFISQATAGGTRIAIDGDLSIYHAAEIKQHLIDGVRDNELLELDLSRVGEIDSAGFQLLALAKRESQRIGHGMSIVAHSPAVSDVIEFFNMAAFFGDPLVIPAGTDI